MSWVKGNFDPLEQEAEWTSSVGNESVKFPPKCVIYPGKNENDCIHNILVSNLALKPVCLLFFPLSDITWQAVVLDVCDLAWSHVVCSFRHVTQGCYSWQFSIVNASRIYFPQTRTLYLLTLFEDVKTGKRWVRDTKKRSTWRPFSTVFAGFQQPLMIQLLRL